MSTGVILASSHEPIGKKSTHQYGKKPSSQAHLSQNLVLGYLAQTLLQNSTVHKEVWKEFGWDIWIYIYIYNFDINVHMQWDGFKVSGNM